VDTITHLGDIARDPAIASNTTHRERRLGIAERRRREKQERHAAILRAADAVFRSRGVSDATMDDIARAAEVSKGTLYLYFQNKDHLFLTIASQFLEELTVTLAALPVQGTGFERAQRVFTTYAEFAQRHSARCKTSMSWVLSGCPVAEGSQGLDQYRELVGELYRLFSEAIDAGKKDGSIASDLLTSELVVQIWAGTFGVLTLEMSGEELSRRIPQQLPGVRLQASAGRPVSESLVPSFVDFLLRGLRASAVPRAPETA
jgi:AcrR family transcriptional regulator